MSFQLNAGQQAGIVQLKKFINDRDQTMICISGSAGTGKSTLAREILKYLDLRVKTKKLLHIDYNAPNVHLCATTNKACESLAVAMAENPKELPEVRTIHSLLNLMLHRDELFRQVLIDTNPTQIFSNDIIIIDEASYIDSELFDYIKLRIPKDINKFCKIIFMGDQAQLTSANSLEQPVFTSGIPIIELTEVMRQDANNPIRQLSSILREAILKGYRKLPPCIIDNTHITWVSRERFEELMFMDMTSPDWSYNVSKYLGYRNKPVQKYNKAIYAKVTGDHVFKEGDQAINNEYINNKQTSIKTDALITIEDIQSGQSLGCLGHHVKINNTLFFLPDNPASKELRITRARNKLEKMLETPLTSRSPGEDQAVMDLRKTLDILTSTWIDLRPVYAQTVHKAQGATYRRVYIDLHDLSICKDINQLMRLLYVAISRAQMQVFLTGDI